MLSPLSRWLFCIAAIAWIAHAPISAAEDDKKLTIKFFVDYVVPPVSPEGFRDVPNPDLIDSAADLRGYLHGRRYYPTKKVPGPETRFVRVARADEADIILTVTGRGTTAESFGERTVAGFYLGVLVSETAPVVSVTRWVSVVMSVGTYKKEFSTFSTNRSRSSAGAWRADAVELARMVGAWAMTNAIKIRERQGGG